MKLKMIALLVGLLLVARTVSSQEVTVETYTGSGGRNTRPFAVQDGWEIQWDAKGGIFQLFLYTASGDLVDIPSNQQGPGEGASYQAKGGQYYLQVNAIGNWTIKIVQLKQAPSPIPRPQHQQPGPVDPIASFSGSGGQNTRPFVTAGPWEIQWDAKGSIFQLFLYGKSGELVGVPANQQGPGQGTSYQAVGGSYYLQVNAIGAWSITIVPVK